MKPILLAYALALVCVPALTFAATTPARPDLSGEWILNEKESDLPRPPMRNAAPRGMQRGMGGEPGMGPRGEAGGPPMRGMGGMGGPGGMDQGGPGMGRPRQDGPGGPPPRIEKRLTIRQEGDTVIFEAADGWARTLRPDATAQAAPQEKKKGPTTVAKWDGARFVVTSDHDCTPRMIDTYEVSADRHKLTVTSRVENCGEETRTFKRVYDAMK